jgi:adenine phosphoribosyltransferase
MNEMIQEMVQQLKGEKIDAVAAVEARGFIFGAMLAHELSCPFIPVRKAGKLPYITITEQYALEYGTASVEIHSDAVMPGWRVLVHDDLLATGGTAGAAARLITRLGAEVAGFSFLVNLSFLPGERQLIEQFGLKPKFLVSY